MLWHLLRRFFPVGASQRRPACLPPAQITPAEHSEKFVAAAGGFSTPDAVQKGGCHVAAMQIAAEPLLRQEVRRQYQVGPAVPGVRKQY